MSDYWDSGYPSKPVYSVWYKGEFAGNTRNADDIGPWALGKNLTKIRILKDDIEIPLKSENSDVREFINYIKSFQLVNSILEDELFEI